MARITLLDIKFAKKRFLLRKATYNKATGCLEWNYALNRENGYPQVTFMYKTFKVHRLMLAFKVGRFLAPDEQACHKCDNTRCISTAVGHVYLGNGTRNQLDRWNRAANG